MGKLRSTIPKTRRTLVNNKLDICEVFLINMNGINPKVPKQKIKLKTLGEFVNQSEHKIPFFVIIETHPKNYIFDAEVEVKTLYSYQRRQGTICGGVAIYI